MPRLRIAVLALLLGAVLAAPSSASAGQLLPLTCPGQSTSQPFLRWGDPFRYRLAEGGDLEDGAAGWKLSGAQSILGNEVYNLAGGSRALGLPGGSSATSPVSCVSLLSPTVRFMVRSTGSPLGILLVTAVVRDGHGLLDTLPMGVVTGLSPSWRPSLPMVLAGALLPNLGDDNASVQFRFTTTGLGGAFQIDDVYVDPYGRG